MTIKSLYEGSYIIDSSKKFIPIENIGLNTKGIKIAINPFLVKNANDLLLVDTGLGIKSPSGNLKIHENLQNIGFEAKDITTILLTHLHYDHIGGTFFLNANNVLEASFKNAKYYLQEKELDKMLKVTTNSKHKQLLIALKNHKNTVFLNGNGKINDSIEYKITGGHTEFHQIFIINSDSDIIVCGGDVIPISEQIKIKFIAKYDFDGRQSLSERLYYADYLAKHNGICLFYHCTSTPIGRISKNNNKFTITNIEQ